MSRTLELKPQLITCHGARAAEQHVLDLLDGLAPRSAADLDPPVRVIVPSKSLRRHLLGVLVRERGALAGVVVQTLQAVALEILDRARLAVPRGDAAFELLVRRLARSERALRSPLEAFEDGYGAVLGPVRDLLDAGFEPALEEGVLERIDELAGSVARPRLARARALVQLASRSQRAVDELGLWRLADALRLAEEALVGEPGLLPARALVVHGFADVTGLAADLLRVLVRNAEGVVVVDRPPDPAEPAREDAGTTFLDRFLQSFAHLGGVVDERRSPPAELELAEAPDPESELRWVAERVLELLDSGCEAEDIGVVARSLEGLAPRIRRHFGRLGIPFSGVGASAPGPARRLPGLVEALSRGAELEVDRWTEAWGDGEQSTALLLGLRTLGVQRVSDAAALVGGRGRPRDLRLPMDVALLDEGEGAGDPGVLPASVIAAAAARAASLVRAFERWPSSASAAVHSERTAEVLPALGWERGCDGWSDVEEVLAAAASELPPSFSLDRVEWLRILGDRLRERIAVPLGGAGGGVQVLSVMEARARTFRQLFVVAVNRGLFPRILAEDALLPETLRARLSADVLPHVPLRARSADEERYLFAQLLSSAPSVSLSWHLGAGDATLSRSPFIDRLGPGSPARAVVRVPGLWALEGGNDRVRPAWEHAIVAAVRGRGAGMPPLLEAAFEETALGNTGIGSSGELAAARAAVLAAVEARAGAGAGPWSGFVGTAVDRPGRAAWVTQLEAVATCPWRAFVNRRLGVRPLADPLLDLPDPGGRLLGLVVHEVLEGIVLEVIGEPVPGLEAALERAEVRVPWPRRERFEELLRAAAQRVARDEGMAALGLGRLLAARARPYLEVARELEWGEDGVLAGVLAAEVVGTAQVAAAAQPLAFRADRVTRRASGALLVDYKTGAPWTKVQDEGKRRRDVLARIARGRNLQAMAYALAPEGGGEGRYLFLKPEVDGPVEARSLTVAADDAEAVALWAGSVAAVGAASELGVVFPRVEEPGSSAVPAHCRSCEIAECCLRDDSRFRKRLVDFMAEEAPGATAAEIAARRLWWLGVEREEEP